MARKLIYMDPLHAEQTAARWMNLFSRKLPLAC